MYLEGGSLAGIECDVLHDTLDSLPDSNIVMDAETGLELCMCSVFSLLHNSACDLQRINGVLKRGYLIHGIL